MTIRQKLAWALGMWGAVQAPWAWADEDRTAEDILVACRYQPGTSFQTEAVHVVRRGERAVDKAEEQAALHVFAAKNEEQRVRYRVEAGQAAECVFPSGNRVRVKAGSGRASAYGFCGGDPEVFVSVWVNGRKVVSKETVGGQCWDAPEQPGPRVTFTYDGWLEAGEPPRLRFRQCASREKPVEVEACVRYPDVARFEPDAVEYPPSGVTPPAVGSFETVAGSGAVCETVRTALAEHGYGEWENAAGVEWPQWQDGVPPQMQDMLPQSWRQDGAESMKATVYDFDNDGRADRVLSRSFGNHYQDGDVLLVQPEGAKSAGRAVWYLPFQLDVQERVDIAEYPPFSQAHDGAEFVYRDGEGRALARFDGRYTNLLPFRFEGQSVLLLGGNSVDVRDVYAVLKPLPEKRVQSLCLIRKVTENF